MRKQERHAREGKKSKEKKRKKNSEKNISERLLNPTSCIIG
jgi:hypothetical protein